MNIVMLQHFSPRVRHVHATCSISRASPGHALPASLTIAPGWAHLAPIFTIGKFYEQEGRTMMPLALQIHHAAADGYHSTRLVEELRQIIADPDWVRD